MFALEILFHDGISPNEIIYVRRPHAIIGNSEFAHIIIEGTSHALSEVRLSRGLGREFYCHPLRRPDQLQNRPAFVEGVYSGEAELDLGGVSARITPLDMDLLLQPDEAPDQAGLRILRRALTAKTPIFPAVAVLGSVPLFVSFPASQSLLIGRSRSCGLRLDSADVSSEHSRIGFENGHFWVEDLGSSNGTFVGSVSGERVSGRRVLDSSERLMLGSEIMLAGVASMEDVSRLSFRSADEPVPITAVRLYPAVVSTSEAIKPSRFELTTGKRVAVGRDPASDIWISAAHISRVHAELELRDDGRVEITDTSSNGILFEGQRLPKESPVMIREGLAVFDLNAGLQFAVCHSVAEEEEFRTMMRGKFAPPDAPQRAAIPNPPEAKPSEALPQSAASFLSENESQPEYGFQSAFGEETAPAPFASSWDRRPHELGTLDDGTYHDSPEEFQFDEFMPEGENEVPISRLGKMTFVLASAMLVLVIAALVFF